MISKPVSGSIPDINNIFKYSEVTTNEHSKPTLNQFQPTPKSRQVLQPRSGLNLRQKTTQSTIFLTQDQKSQNSGNTYTEDILNSILPPR